MESEEEEEKKQPTSALPDKAVEDTVSKIIHKYCSSNKFRIHSLTKCVKFSKTKGFVRTFRISILSDFFCCFQNTAGTTAKSEDKPKVVPVKASTSSTSKCKNHALKNMNS